MELTAAELQLVMEAALRAVGMGAAAPAAEAEEPELVHRNERQFFDGYLSSVFARDLGRDDVRWCNQWYAHPESAQVVTALWRSWEQLHLDERTGLAVWLVNFAYPLMRQLFDSAGTFAGCSGEAHYPPPPLPED